MKILVPVKRVVDYNVKVRVKSDGSGVELANVKMSMNPFDEIAVEEALRLKEKGQATEIVVVDDGSTDGTLAIARRYESSKVKVISQPNGGQPAAYNTAAAVA